MALMRTLFCEKGQHEWERESQRGKLPKNCPEHRLILTSEHKAKMQEGKQRKIHTEREQRIQERIEGKHCSCGIEATMTDAELRALYPGCADPTCICPVLDNVMRSVYSYVSSN